MTTLLLAGCTYVVLPTDDPAQGGMGVPQQLTGETYPGPAVTLRGTVLVAQDGCAYLRGDGTHLVIWPRGSMLSAPVRLPDGTELRDGDEITIEGRLLPAADLPGGADGYWAHVTGFCDGGLPEVVVADRVSAGR